MKNQNPKALRQPSKPNLAKAKEHQLPPDPDELLKRAAARGKKVVAMYEKLNPDTGRYFLLLNLLFDLLQLCDRDPGLGNLDEELVAAIDMYEKFVEQNKFAAG